MQDSLEIFEIAGFLAIKNKVVERKAFLEIRVEKELKKLEAAALLGKFLISGTER